MKIDLSKDELEDLLFEKRQTRKAIESGYDDSEATKEPWKESKDWQDAHKLCERLKMAIRYYNED